MAGRPQHSDATTAIGERPETRGALTREDQAKLEIGRTDVPRWLAAAMTALFLLAITVVPISQTFRDDQAGDIFSAGQPVREAWRSSAGSPIEKLFAANAEALRQIKTYEDDLEKASWMTQRLLGPVTQIQVRYFDVGNEEAYLGRDGWLFYRPDVDHVMGPGFLEASWLAARAAAGNEYTEPPQPDPRKAILQFHRQLAERGIELIVMPTPVKPTVAPGRFTVRYADHQHALRNVSYRRFVDELRTSGVGVFDPTERLIGPEQYLRADTHWTPEAMQRVAAALAERLRPMVGVGSSALMKVEQRSVTHVGDIAAMLELPEEQTLYSGQTVTIRRIPEPPEGDARVLLLGDSFTNIYSMAELGWGTWAGLGEQLSYELRQPVDVIAINAGGSHAARRALVGDLARGEDRLAGKQVVVWQFAARELSHGDWKLMALPAVQRGVEDPSDDVEGAITATATVAARTDPPRPGSVPYRDAIIAVRLKNVEGGNLPDELLVYTWGLRDDELVDAGWRTGERVTVRLSPWAEAEEQYGQFNRFELEDPDALFLDAYWGEVME